MFGSYRKDLDFDIIVAKECAITFSKVTNLGCCVSDTDDQVLFEANYTCSKCSLCSNFVKDRNKCNLAHSYGMGEAERFGGKYVYYCPIGMSFFVSPIIGNNGAVAKMTVGPFLMVEPEEFMFYELKRKLELKQSDEQLAEKCLEEVPFVAPSRANDLSTLLYMLVGFINKASSSERLMAARNSYAIQGQISSFIQNLKVNPLPITYPVETESAFLHAISISDKQAAQRLLNELLGHVFFASMGDFGYIKSRSLELLILMSRATISGGADSSSIFSFNQKCIDMILSSDTVEELCFYLIDLTNSFMNSTFEMQEAKHIDTIQKAVAFIRENYDQKISLSKVSSMVYLSPPYFSKVFNQEMGCSFTHYLNSLRVEKSKVFLLEGNMSIGDIALKVGFSDKEYFSKVFKKIVGCGPLKFKKTKGIAYYSDKIVYEEKELE